MIFARLLPLLVLLLTPISPARAAAGELNYTLYVLGFPIADAAIGVDMGPAAYLMTMRYHTTGIAKIVSSDHLEYKVRGAFDGDRPVPLDYSSIGRLRGQDRLMGLTYRDNTPIVTQISPPNDTEREDVPTALRVRTVDPLSTIVTMLRKVTTTGRCDGSARSYDGRRVESFEMRTVGNEDIPASGRSSFSGRALRCDFTSRILAGFRLGDSRADDTVERHGTIWLAQVVNGGARLPVRAAVETRWFGDATIYLTGTTP
ncbi:MAG: DUF3108 domain-containing protein [Acetobacteraceae bacterium]|nr:DUF3108 domain-containing protein [Acetobacteraceae bacterium]